MKDWSNEKTISVVLGSYNRLGFIKITIDNLRSQLEYLGDKAEIIVVDGGSSDGTLEWLVKQKDIITIAQHNRGQWRGKEIIRRSWGYFMNLGFKTAQGKYVCMVSDDCVLRKDCIKNGINLFEDRLANGEKIGAMAFYFRNWPEQEKYCVGTTLADKMNVNHGIYLRKALEEVNFADEDAVFFCYPDGDLILSIWDKGYKCIDSPTSLVEHYSHANYGARTANGKREKEDWESFTNKWKGKFYFGEKKEEAGRWIELSKVPELCGDEYVKRLEKYHFINKFSMLRVDLPYKIKKWLKI